MPTSVENANLQHLELVVRDMPGATGRAVLLREGFRRLAEPTRPTK